MLFSNLVVPRGFRVGAEFRFPFCSNLMFHIPINLGGHVNGLGIANHPAASSTVVRLWPTQAARSPRYPTIPWWIGGKARHQLCSNSFQIPQGVESTQEVIDCEAYAMIASQAQHGRRSGPTLVSTNAPDL